VEKTFRFSNLDMKSKMAIYGGQIGIEEDFVFSYSF
jgi:hypothetical protein